MKFLAFPDHDDFNIVRVLSKTMTLSSYPLLLAELQRIEDCYRDYDACGGNAWDLNSPLLIGPVLSDALRLHYKTPPKGLIIIEHIRNLGSPTVCPMCGSLKPSQVDHVAPKDIYPEFSFFSRNLVPACDCNGLKKLTFKGKHPGERILHPYYDEVMKERLVYLYFSENLESPHVTLLISPDHHMNMAVQFHVEHILRKTRIFYWANSKWATLLRTPEKFIPALKYHLGELGINTLIKVVAEQLENADDIYGTPNNWESMFLAGVMQSHNVMNFLAHRVNSIRSGKLLPD